MVNRILGGVLCAFLLSAVGLAQTKAKAKAAPAPAAAAKGGATLDGVYSNAENLGSVEFRSGGKAHLSLSGLSTPVTYKVEGSKVTVDFDGEIILFTIEADGTLTGPKDTFWARLRKKKD